MHGLRCDPALLGWTRLLDEWVVGLTRYNRSTPSDPVCWEDRGRTLSTFADAATRVRSFAYRDTDIEATVPLAGAMLSFELQGRSYRVATDQLWPSIPDAMTAVHSRFPTSTNYPDIVTETRSTRAPSCCSMPHPAPKTFRLE